MAKIVKVQEMPLAKFTLQVRSLGGLQGGCLLVFYPLFFYPFFPFFVHPFFGPIYRSGHLESCKVAVVLLVQMGFYLFLTRFLAYLTLFVHSFLDPNKGLVTFRVAG